jgi:hypothetical protein
VELLKRTALITIASIGFAGIFCLNLSGQSHQPQILYFPHLADGGGYSSAWHFTGLSAGTSVVTVELFDQDGYPLTIATDHGTSIIFRFTLGNSASASLRTLGAGAAVKVGWAKMTATQPVGASEHFSLIGAGGAIIAEAEVPASTSVAAAQANTTYALRSVCYERSDLLAVFRVLRFDSDGSVILVWKQLSSFAVPHTN